MNRKYMLELESKFQDTGSVKNKERQVENPVRNDYTEGYFS